MKLLATIPPPHERGFAASLESPDVAEVRFNVGARSPWSPRETLARIVERAQGKTVWVDLKGRQLRIAQWAVPTFGDIILNHEIEIETPATIVFRGGDTSTIREARGRKIFVDPPPRAAVGAGQAVNIHARHLAVRGYLTEEDEAYLDAAQGLGLDAFMLSFVEQQSDLDAVLERCREAKLALKIESPRGLAWVEAEYSAAAAGGQVRLVAARDDLWINIGDDKLAMVAALRLLIERDPGAIVASRLFTSLGRLPAPDMADVSDAVLMHSLGYRAFMLSDGVSRNELEGALSAWRALRRAVGDA